jgi:hypothetical protein
MRGGAANANRRARVSKDEDERPSMPSCFETPRHSVLKTRVNALKARLLSMRAGEGGRFGEARHESWRVKRATCRCRKSSRPPIHCFRLFLTMEKATRACESLRARGSVIAGLAPAIHLLRKKFLRRRMDPRVKPAGDGRHSLLRHAPPWAGDPRLASLEHERRGWHRNSGLPELRNIECRKSGKPDLR